MSHELAFIPTKGAVNKNPQDSFKAVTYCSYKPKVREKKNSAMKEKFNSSEAQMINMKRARHEIVKFGMSGFDPQKKEEAQVQLAIQLGAKPRKNKYKNYKQLLEEKKKEKETVKLHLDFQQLGKNQVGKSTAKGKSFDRKRRKQKSDLLDLYGQVKPKLKSK